MSLFNRILDKLGLRKDKQEEKESAATGTATAGRTASMPRKPSAGATNPKTTGVRKPARTAPTSNRGVRSSTPGVAGRRQDGDVAVKQTAAPQAMSRVDVMDMLEQKAKGTGLNWKQSISDLLFLLDIENSYEARVELAKELNAPQEVMGDSARMNTWLHKEVLRKIAENGGNIPQNLLD